MLQDKIFKLKGKVQHYDWGGTEYIPHWLGIENKENKPFAEYWMGAHPSASSTIEVNGKEENLYDLIQHDAAACIGEKVHAAFGELPYLFKILDVKDMLSIQVHPSKESAAKGFAEEEAKGVAIHASNRNYKDKNHKPEVMVALSEFWLLHGFLNEDKLLKVLQTVPEFKGLESIVMDKGYKGLYEHVMLMPQNEADALLAPLVQREAGRKKNNELTKADAGWWVAKLYGEEQSLTHLDRGLFSIYFFNIVKANPGEAVFQGAGLPHAYLEGQNVELMANSDNVLRGGLTPKHIDVPELIKHIIFEGIEPNVMNGIDLTSGEKNYPCPVPDFGISKIELQAGETYKTEAASLEIIVIIEGALTVEGSNKLTAARGEAVAVLAGEAYTISTPGRLVAYKAFVP
ncbi:mannose-6-phosphate isomerase, class I [Parafilimonas sp.]|uniref:mannose-6-phosphate isomerase, class I n=1 Tax=Parafilimonas sp. TaxID=1969739 RepID=UPI0039E2E638